jgi:predicted porin
MKLLITLFFTLYLSDLVHASLNNIEIYGNATVYINRDKSDSAPITGLENEMYLGFRSKEKTSDDLTTLFQFESSYMGDHGAVLGGRSTFVGVSSRLGSLKLGRLTTPLYDVIDWPFSHILGQNFDWRNPVSSMGMADRSANTIRYDIPTTNGLNFGIAVAQQDSKAKNYVDTALNYQVKDITLYGGYQIKKNDSKEKNATSLIGVQYSLNGYSFYTAVKIINLNNAATAYTDEDTSGMETVSINDSIKQNNYVAAISKSFDNFSIKLAITLKDNLKLNNVRMRGTNASEAALQGVHNLSPRTLIFSRITIFDNNLHTKYASSADNQDSNRFYLGLSHDF